MTIACSWVQQAAEAPDTQGRVFIVVFFVSFHTGEGGSVPSALAARVDHLPPRVAGAGRFPGRRARWPPRAQPQCSRPGARGTPGLVVLRGAGRGRAGVLGWGHGGGGRPASEVRGRARRRSLVHVKEDVFKNLKPSGS